MEGSMTDKKDGLKKERMNECMDGWMSGWMDGWMGEWMDSRSTVFMKLLHPFFKAIQYYKQIVQRV